MNSTTEYISPSRINDTNDLLMIIFINLAFLILTFYALHRYNLRIKALEDNKFEKYFIKNSEIELSNQTCSICLDYLNNNSAGLECNHYYHKDCIISWLKEKAECPNCRNNLSV